MFPVFKKRNKINIKRLSDESLIENFVRNKDNDCFDEIFNRYTHLVFGVCLKYLKDEAEAKDAVMQIFENLITNINETEIKNFKSWIYTVSKNHCLMKLRKEKSELKKTKDYIKDISQEFMELSGNYHPHIEEDDEIVFKKLDNALKKLKDEQRICVELLYLQNKSYAEISGITGYTIKQVKSFVQNGKRNIRNYLETNEGDSK